MKIYQLEYDLLVLYIHFDVSQIKLELQEVIITNITKVICQGLIGRFEILLK